MRAQVFTFDIFISLIFFVSVFTIWLLITNQLTEQASYSYEINMLDKKLQRASDLLIRSKGLPEDWDETNVKAFGLAEEEYIVNFTKVLNFNGSSEQKIKGNLGISGYNLYIRITNITGYDFPEGKIEIGNYPSSEARVVVSIKRYFLMDFETRKELAMMQIIAWR